MSTEPDFASITGDMEKWAMETLRAEIMAAEPKVAIDWLLATAFAIYTGVVCLGGYLVLREIAKAVLR